MASMRDIKRRIKSVGSTQQITKAMNLVAASKLQRSKARLEATRPFCNEMRRAVSTLVQQSEGSTNKYLAERFIRNTAVLVICSDRGLCGGYNVNVCKAASKAVKGKENVSFITVGLKARDYFHRRRRNIIHKINGISESPFYEDAVDIGNLILKLYESGSIDEVFVVYSEFKSVLRHDPKVVRVLPVDNKESETKSKTRINYEPGEEEVLDYIVPKYLNTVIFGALVEASACEQGARMTSMDAATENANKMIGKLSLSYNRARQGAITQELTEIVSGANAL